MRRTNARRRAAQASEIGRALFRSPDLAGRAGGAGGLSCNACHSNGRVNARFLLPELTDRAGAADVTSEWSSKTRGDGVANPVRYSGSRGRRRSATASDTRATLRLEHFVHGVIVEEFQGEAPPAQALIA